MHTNVLRIDVSYLGGMVVVAVQGEIDMETAPTFRVALDQLEGPGHVCIDMAIVRFRALEGWIGSYSFTVDSGRNLAREN